MTTRTKFLVRLLAAAAVLTALAAVPASADTPPAGYGNVLHGFLVKDGVVTTIDHPKAATIPSTPDGQTGTSTPGINDRGDVLGLYEDRKRVLRHFVRDRKGRYTLIADPPSGSGYEVLDINNRGEIVGFFNDAQGNTTTGFLRSKRGRFRTIDVPGSEVTAAFKINDRRQVVGLYIDSGGKAHGFLWDDGAFTAIDVPGAESTAVYGINNRGQMVGSYRDAAGAFHAFLRARSGAVTTLPEAPGADPMMGGTVPSSINDRGQIAGGASDARGGSRGFLLERGVYRMFDGSRDATYTRALDISNRGRIVGDYGTRPSADLPAAAGNLLRDRAAKWLGHGRSSQG